MLTPHWLWSARSLPARLARLALLPPSLAYRSAAAVRARAYRAGLLARSEVAIPVVSVGNLTVGGSGKTPISHWIARYYASRGLRPAIVLRGYGGDEGAVHRRLLESAIVIQHPDRLIAAGAAVAEGADVIILDDGYQRFDVVRDLDVALVSAESGRAVRWTLPAGPWREGWRALGRADVVVVTRKRADREAAASMVERVRLVAPTTPVAIVRLGITCFRELLSGEPVSVQRLGGARVLAAAGIADPHSFAAQCRSLGADVRMYPLEDHHQFDRGDVHRILHASRRVDYVVMTEKDAVKLRSLWPRFAPEPLVAELDVAWELGRSEFETALDAAVTGVEELLQ